MLRSLGPLLAAPMTVAAAAGLLAWLDAETPPGDPISPGDGPAPPPAPVAAGSPPAPPGDPQLATAEGDTLRFLPVVITGYTSCPRETDSTPFLTASMTRVRPGCLALSRDLLRTFTPEAPFDFGDWVVLPGVGIFVVEDTMNARWRNRADIWFANRRQALHWGRRRALIARLPRPLEDGGGLFALGPAGRPGI